MIILFLALAVFLANFLAANYYTGQENKAREPDRGPAGAVAAACEVLARRPSKAATPRPSTSSRPPSRASTPSPSALRSGGRRRAGLRGQRARCPASAARWSKVTDTWSPMAPTPRPHRSESEDQILNLSDTASAFTARVPRSAARSTRWCARCRTPAPAPRRSTIANRQIVLADRMSRRVTEILAGGEGTVIGRRRAVARRRGVRPGAGGPEARQRGNRRHPRNLHRRRSTPLDAVDKLYAESLTEMDVVLQRLDRPVRGAAGLGTRSPVIPTCCWRTRRRLFATFGSSLGRFFPNNLLGDLLRPGRPGRDPRPAVPDPQARHPGAGQHQGTQPAQPGSDSAAAGRNGLARRRRPDGEGDGDRGHHRRDRGLHQLRDRSAAIPGIHH